MGELSEANWIWNRACDHNSEPRLPGDRALFDVIGFDALIQNGGLDHAIDAVPQHEVEASAAGLRFFGADDVADIVDRAQAIAARVVNDEGRVDIPELADEEGEELKTLEARYFDRLPTAELTRVFEAHLAAHPEDFEPLNDKQMTSLRAMSDKLEEIARRLGMIE